MAPAYELDQMNKNTRLHDNIMDASRVEILDDVLSVMRIIGSIKLHNASLVDLNRAMDAHLYEADEVNIKNVNKNSALDFLNIIFFFV